MKAFQYCVAVLSFCLIASSVQADESFVIRGIAVEGLQHTEMSTVLDYLPVKSGDHFDETASQDIVKHLFDTGFFDDVRITPANPDITIHVVERPIIAEITINGAVVINDSLIKKVLKDRGIAESLIFNPASFDNLVKSVKSAYLDIGKYDVDITTVLKKLDQNRLAITVNISEGKTTTIKAIHIVGTKAISEKTLRQEMFLTTGKLMSWQTKDNQYAQDKLKQDLERIKRFYQDHGFFKMSVESTQVLLSSDKKSIELLINIKEGKAYQVGDITLLGETILPKKLLYALLRLKKGELFRYTPFQASISAITSRLGEEGYAFAEAQLKERIDEERALIHFDVEINPGRRVYVRHIDITGNLNTRDEVIRREMRLAEYSLFNQKKIDRSKERIIMLNYFNAVNIRIKPVENVVDQVDLEVIVQEKQQMGEVHLMFSYSKAEGFAPVINVRNPNIFGSGKLLELGLSINTLEQLGVLSYGDPYFTNDGIYLGGKLSFKRSLSGEGEGKRDQRVLTADILSKVPVTENDNVTFGFGAERNTCTGDVEYCKQYKDQGSALTGQIGFVKDTRDLASFPTRGLLTSIQLKAGLPTGQLQYYLIQSDQAVYFPLHDYVTLALKGSLYLGGGYGKTTTLPFFKNQQAGGIGTIRGFRENSLGEYNWLKDDSGKYVQGQDCVGGSNRLLASAELRFPIFGLAKKNEVQMSVFFDLASVWGPTTQKQGENKAPESEITFHKGRRRSTGLGLIWVSPVGPIEFSYTLWRDKKENDHIENFQFSLGTTF
ncbi:MAG: outer membrane protein assembly factor BamA [Neisseriales bacterium]|nr:MAG: outer membrane protein assembly factor BamA [Neisseriales bacterium]